MVYEVIDDSGSEKGSYQVGGGLPPAEVSPV